MTGKNRERKSERERGTSAARLLPGRAGNWSCEVECRRRNASQSPIGDEKHTQERYVEEPGSHRETHTGARVEENGLHSRIQKSASASHSTNSILALDNQTRGYPLREPRQTTEPDRLRARDARTATRVLEVQPLVRQRGLRDGLRLPLVALRVPVRVRLALLHHHHIREEGHGRDRVVDLHARRKESRSHIKRARGKPSFSARGGPRVLLRVAGVPGLGLLRRPRCRGCTSGSPSPQSP